jgi:hypothetical protein
MQASGKIHFFSPGEQYFPKMKMVAIKSNEGKLRKNVEKATGE